jgi:hypothetical protein
MRAIRLLLAPRPFGVRDRAVERDEAAVIARLVPASSFHGVHGIRFSPTGELFAGSVAGQSLYRVDRAPAAPRWWWAAARHGGRHRLRTRRADGVDRDLRRAWSTAPRRRPRGGARQGSSSINSIAFSRDGRRLFAAQVFGGDALWELDPAGKRRRARSWSRSAGSTASPRGRTAGSTARSGSRARSCGSTPTRALWWWSRGGLQTPAAAKFDSQDRLYVIDTATGELIRVDVATGAKTRVAQLSSSLDNFSSTPRTRRS